jgi:hypothetical protein
MGGEPAVIPCPPPCRADGHGEQGQGSDPHAAPVRPAGHPRRAPASSAPTTRPHPASCSAGRRSSCARISPSGGPPR